jgi:protein SCO1/2
MRLGLLLPVLICLASASSVADEADPHAHHHMMMTSGDVRVSHAAYDIPDVRLKDDFGHEVQLRKLLSDDQPTVVNFIYTSCTTVCPVMTATLLQLQRELAADPTKPRLISISIDPEFDSAPILRAYSERFGASWTFLTGDRNDVLSVLRSFDAWRGNKANHIAITLLRAPGNPTWTRVEGLAPAADLVQLWKGLEPS